MPVVGAAGLEGPAPEGPARAVCMMGWQQGEDQEDGNPEEHGGRGVEGATGSFRATSPDFYNDCGGEGGGIEYEGFTKVHEYCWRTRGGGGRHIRVRSARAPWMSYDFCHSEINWSKLYPEMYIVKVQRR